MVQQSDRLKLANFLSQTRSDLDWILRNMDTLAPTLESVREPGEPSQMQVAFDLAWSEFNRENAPTSLEQVIRELAEGSERYDRLLDQHGLTGAQLQLKLLIVESHRDIFEESKKKLAETQWQEENSNWSNLLASARRIFRTRPTVGTHEAPTR